MKKILVLIAVLAASSQVFAQKDSTVFRAYLINNKYNVYLNIDLYKESIEVPGQELYGRLPGYLGVKHNSFCWLITSAKISKRKATLQLINDYGSEDLSAELIQENDSVYSLRQLSGSALKIPKSGKWQRLPKSLELRRVSVCPH